MYTFFDFDRKRDFWWRRLLLALSSFAASRSPSFSLSGSSVRKDPSSLFALPSKKKKKKTTQPCARLSTHLRRRRRRHLRPRRQRHPSALLLLAARRPAPPARSARRPPSGPSRSLRPCPSQSRPTTSPPGRPTRGGRGPRSSSPITPTPSRSNSPRPRSRGFPPWSLPASAGRFRRGSPSARPERRSCCKVRERESKTQKRDEWLAAVALERKHRFRLFLLRCSSGRLIPIAPRASSGKPFACSCIDGTRENGRKECGFAR